MTRDLEDYDWDGLRAMWVAHADLAARAMATQRTDETFYVLVFMLEGIDGAMIAMNSLEAMDIGPDERAGKFDDAVWTPYEWRDESVDFDDPEGENVRRYRALLDFAKDGSRQHRRAVEARHDETIVQAAMEVAERVRQGLGAFGALKRADDFVVFVREHDVRRPFVMAQRTIPRELQERLFGEELELDRERSAIARLPDAERIAYLVARLGQFGPPISSEEAGEQLVAAGAPAVAPLMALLDDPKVGWTAAKLIGEIGSPHADVAVDALAKLLRTKKSPLPSQRWAACALGDLGRFDELMTHQDDTARLPLIAAGLARGLPHTFPQLATLMESGNPKAESAVTQALAPGRGGSSAAPQHFALVIEHATSPHEAIRKEVALILGDPELLPDDKPRAVAALVAMLGDPASEVRRLAALALERLRGDAVAALPVLRALEQDRVANVAEGAARAIAEITWRPATRA